MLQCVIIWCNIICIVVSRKGTMSGFTRITSTNDNVLYHEQQNIMQKFTKCGSYWIKNASAVACSAEDAGAEVTGTLIIIGSSK